MNRTQIQAKEFYESSLGHGVKFVTEKKLKQNFPDPAGAGMSGFVVYANSSTLTVDSTNESFTTTGEGVYAGINGSFTYGDSSFVLTVVAKNLTEVQKFNNTSGAFGGLYLVTADTNRLYRMVSNGSSVTAIRIMGFDAKPSNKLPWFNGSLLTGTELVWV
jgi:hypothetical protein